MRVPIRHIAGHLVWSAQGGVWALYRLHPGPDEEGQHTETVQGTYVPASVREEAVAQAAQLVRALPGLTPRLFSVCAQLDPGEVALRMLEGVDPAAGTAVVAGDGHPWAETVTAALDLLDGQEMHQRTLWLAVPLQIEGARAAWSGAWGALWAELSALLGMRPAPVGRRELSAYRERAGQVEAQLGGSVALRAATPAEVVWLVRHALCRGLAEPRLSEARTSPLYGGRLAGGRLRSPSYADLGQVRLQEGGTDPDHEADESEDQEDSGAGQETGARFTRRTRRPGKDGGGAWWRRRSGTSPLRRRWLQVETDQGCGYQAHLALAECPPAVGAESADLLAQLEALDFPVDAVMDLDLVPADKAQRQVAKKKNELVDQAEQYDARPTGTPASLLDAARDLGEMDARLSRTSVEVEVQSVTVLTVWGASPQVCEARARALESLLNGEDYRAVRPTGLQAELFALGLPGTTRPVAAREFTQHQLSEDWAMTGALAAVEAGDPDGMLLGIDLDVGTTRPVTINLADAPQVDAPASFGMVADPGAGKSVTEKLLAQAVTDRGGQAICVDRTPLREWASFARSAAPGRCQIIDAATAALSIDPLRLFPGAQGAHYALSYLTLQLGVGSMSTAGGLLHRAVEQAAASKEPSLHQVRRELEEMARAKGARGQEAATLVDLLRIVAGNPLSRMVFDPELPPVRLDAADSDLIVITTAGLTLPSKEACANPDLLRQQPLEALIGRAVLYLIAALARQQAFADPSRFCALVTDELWWLTSSTEGSALVSEFLHDGRKHDGGLIAAAQDEEELGPDRGLFSYRGVGRITSRDRARRALDYLGLDSADKKLVRLVTTGLSPVGQRGREGELLLAAPRQNISRVKVIIPAVPRIADGIDTTPGRAPAPRPAPASGAETAPEDPRPVPPVRTTAPASPAGGTR